MPSFNKYSPSNKKDGYFIRANVGGSHPITLQIGSVAEKILQDNGFRHGDNIPTKVIWSMHDVGLVWTENNGKVVNDTSKDIDDVFKENNMNSNLRESTRKGLIEYLQGYEGPQKEALRRLCNALENVCTRSGPAVKHHSKPETIDEAISFLYTQTESLENFKEIKTKANQYTAEVLSSVQMFYSHPYLSGSCTIHEGGLVAYTVQRGKYESVIFDTRFVDSAQAPFEGDLNNIDYITRYVDSDNEDHVLHFRGSRPIAASEKYRRLVETRSILPSPPVPPILVLQAIHGKETNELPKIQMLQGKPIPNPDVDTVHWVEVDRISNNGNPVIETNHGPVILDEGSEGEHYAALETNDTWISVAEEQ